MKTPFDTTGIDACKTISLKTKVAAWLLNERYCYATVGLGYCLFITHCDVELSC